LKVYCRMYAVVLTALCVSIGSVQAQQLITGTVLDVSNRSIAEVRIQAEGPAASESHTDDAGRFVLQALPSGDWTLTISAPGYLTESVSIALGPRQNIELDVRLVSSTADATTVTVTGNYDVGRAQTAQLLTSRDIEQLPPLLTTDISKLVLRTTPGAVLGHDNLVHLKGNELSLHQFIDGVGFLDNPQAQFSPGYSPQYIQSVNIITGGIPAEFGNRLGGVLDVETKSGLSFQGGSLTLGAGTIISRNAGIEYGLGGNKWDAYVYGSGFSDGRYLNPPEPREIHDLGYGAHTLVKLGYRPTSDDRLSLMATGSGTNFQLPNTTEELHLGRDSSKEVGESSAILKWNHTTNDQSLFDVSVFQRYSSSRLVPTTDPETSFGRGFRRTLTNGVKFDAMFLRGGHIIKAGFDASLLSLNEDFFLDPRIDHDAEEGELPVVPPNLFVVLAPLSASSAVTEPLDFTGRQRGGHGGAYIQDRFTILPNLTLHAGLRYDRYSVLVTEGQWSPRIGLSYHIRSTGTVARVVYNRFFVPPPLEYIQLGTAFGTGEIENFEVEDHHEDELRPERIRLPLVAASSEEPPGSDEEGEELEPLGPINSLRQHYFEVGFQQPIRANVVLDVSTYHHQGNNAYENVELSNTRTFIPSTFSRERTWGTTVSLRIRDLGPQGLFGNLHYGYMVTNFYGPASGGIAVHPVAPGQQITPAFDQRHTGSATIGYRHDRSGFDMGLSVGYGSGTPAELHHDDESEHESEESDAAEEEGEEHEEATFIRLPSYWTFDVWAGIPIWRAEKRSIALTFNAENIGNRIFEIAKESEEYPIQYGPRRRLYGQIKFRF
jgi:hypothetical protein